MLERGAVLESRPGRWDARGARVTAVLPDRSAAYDGRATKEEKWRERTGLAVRAQDGAFESRSAEPIADVRSLDVVQLPHGGYRLFYEAP